MLLLVLAVAANAAGNLLVSEGARALGRSAAPAGMLARLGDVLADPTVLMGSILLGVFFVLFLGLLSRADLSWVLPMISACFVINGLLAAGILGESLSPLRWCGIVLVTGGVSLVGRTDPIGRRDG